MVVRSLLNTSSFTTFKQVSVRTYSEDEVQLIEGISFNTMLGRIDVPAGFVSDGASIPSFCWSIIRLHPFHPQVIRAALVHDWLYRTRQLSRDRADLIFYSLLIQDVDTVRAYLMYRAVRMFGGNRWGSRAA